MWSGFFEHLRECGRDATLFIYACLAVAAAWSVVPSLGRLSIPVLAGPFLIALARFVLVWKRASRGFEKLGRLPPLSDQDRRKARERLLQTAVPRKAGATQRIGLPATANRVSLRHT
jgi:hypothetical protein